VKREDIRKLLGGYATGTLTAEERELLFSAALEDQTLFDALANEEPLRELLAEPRTRQELLDELRRPASMWSQFWDQLTPRRLMFAGGLAMFVLVVSGLLYVRRSASVRQPVEVAMSKLPESVDALKRAPAAAPAAEPAKPKVVTSSPSQPPVAVRKDIQTADERRTAGLPAPGLEAAELEKKAAGETRAVQAPRAELDRAARDQSASGKERLAGNILPAAPAPLPAPNAAAAPRFADRQREPDRLIAMDARVTDVNGTIVSIGVGANAGLKIGETLEIVRNDRVIGAVKLTQVGDTFAVGPIQLSAGNPPSAGRLPSAGPLSAGGLAPAMSDPPRVGDALRRPAASQPQK